MARKYSREELQVLYILINKYGHITYSNCPNIEEEYFSLTKIHRASGALYMAAWRLERGFYNFMLT